MSYIYITFSKYLVRKPAPGITTGLLNVLATSPDKEPIMQLFRQADNKLAWLSAYCRMVHHQSEHLNTAVVLYGLLTTCTLLRNTALLPKPCLCFVCNRRSHGI
jgi:hypothetical protein